MNDELRALTAEVQFRGGTTRERIQAVERDLGASFPREYVEFLIETNGGEGPVGEEGYGRFFGVDELLNENTLYRGEDWSHFDGLVVFGTDGGGEAFCFDERQDVILVAYISAREDNQTIGPFDTFMRRLGAGTLL